MNCAYVREPSQTRFELLSRNRHAHTIGCVVPDVNARSDRSIRGCLAAHARICESERKPAEIATPAIRVTFGNALGHFQSIVVTEALMAKQLTPNKRISSSTHRAGSRTIGRKRRTFTTPLPPSPIEVATVEQEGLPAALATSLLRSASDRMLLPKGIRRLGISFRISEHCQPRARHGPACPSC